MALFLWIIRMAAESAANRNVRRLREEMHLIAAHITKQMHYINDELLPAIQSTFIEQIHASTNQEEKDRIVKRGEKAKKEMEETLFNGYNNLLIAINELLQIELRNDKVRIMASVIGSLKMKLKELDRLLKQYRDFYKPRGRLMHNKLESHVEHPYVSPIYTSESYVHIPKSPPKISSLRGSRTSRGHISINPIASEHAVERFGSRAVTTYPSSYISKAKKKAYQELIEKYTNNNNSTNHKLHAAIRRFKLKMAQTHKLRREVQASQVKFNKALAKRKTLKRKYKSENNNTRTSIKAKRQKSII